MQTTTKLGDFLLLIAV